MEERWYRLTELPDLTLNKYASLEDSGVDGVLEKHGAFLRQLNRKGIVSGLSFHLFYFYLVPDDRSKDRPGHRLQIYLMIRGNAEGMENIDAMVKASPLSEFFRLEDRMKRSATGDDACSLENVLKNSGMQTPVFNTCAFLTKTETFLPAGSGEGDDYYIIRDWEMNEDGRLYSMSKMMEALNQTALYRVDLYPVERSTSLREALRKPMNILRRRQDERSTNARKDYDGKDVLENYEDLIEKFDSSPHFIANIMVMTNGREDAVTILDAAGAESLKKGKYQITTISSNFTPDSFLSKPAQEMENMRERMIVRPGKHGLTICRDDAAGINLNDLPTLFSLEEITPFFRLPALYDGETIQLAKETAPASVNRDGSLFLGKDQNGYDVYFPLSLLPKHAFVAGVPGSGKTNTMHHITSSLWKDHRIPFLVLEPAKQEYRALANDPGMKELYVFSPNADMSFPLHINPFEMPRGTLVAEHIRRLCSVFEGAFPLEPPMPFLLDTAIEAVYRENGWIPEHVYTGEEMREDGKERLPLPTMSMLYRRLEQELKSTQYSDEVRGNLESALKVRIGSLLRREMGDVFDVPTSTFTPEEWLEIPAVIELESMGSGPANFLTLMLCALIRETLKVDPKRENSSVRCAASDGRFTARLERPGMVGAETFSIDRDALADFLETAGPEPALTVNGSGGSAVLRMTRAPKGNQHPFAVESDGTRIPGYLSYDPKADTVTFYWGNPDIRHVIFIEEAHNLIGPESEEQSGADADPKQAATAFVVKMLAEVRALKEGIVIADQLPTVMAQEVLKNTGLKLGLRITSGDDRALLGSTMAASGLQLEQMSTFAVGQALIFYEKLKRPFTMRIKEWWGELKDPAEKEAMVSSKNDADLRLAMDASETYRDENLKSIRIIGKKYLMLLADAQKQSAESKGWMQSVIHHANKIKEIYHELELAEAGQLPLSEEQKLRKYDQLELMEATREQVVADVKNRRSVLEMVRKIGGWVYTLERLKNGRWTRFGAPEDVLIKITLVQSMMCDEALGLYRSLIRAVGMQKDIQSISGDVEKLSGLARELNEDLRAFIQIYGSEAIRKI